MPVAPKWIELLLCQSKALNGHVLATPNNQQELSLQPSLIIRAYVREPLSTLVRRLTENFLLLTTRLRDLRQHRGRHGKRVSQWVKLQFGNHKVFAPFATHRIPVLAPKTVVLKTDFIDCKPLSQLYSITIIEFLLLLTFFGVWNVT